MIKILRKYNKYILVVGGSLLMIAFIMPQAVNQLWGNPAKRTAATLGGRKITLGQMEKISHEYRAAQPILATVTGRGFTPDNADHWLLLSTLAEQAGMTAESGDGRDWPALENAIAKELALSTARSQFERDFLEQYRWNRDPEFRRQALEQARESYEPWRARMMERAGLNGEEFDAVLARCRGVVRVLEAFFQANEFSDRRALMRFSDQFEGAMGAAMIVPADRFAHAIADPTEEELKAHFERFRTVKAGDGEFGIGYTLPKRMKFEYLKLDRAAISDAIKLDPIDVNKRWRENKAKYAQDYAVARPSVESEMRAEKANQILVEADGTIRAELSRAARHLTPDGNYKKVPADYETTRPRLEAIAQRVVESLKGKFAIDLPLPTVTVKSAKFLTASDVSALPDIGFSQVRSGSRTIPFADAAFTVRELHDAGANPGADLGLQVGLTSAEVIPTDAAGNKFYFTVLEVRPESPADTLEEVREKAVQDFKVLKAFDALKGASEAIRAIAAADGLDAAKTKAEADFPAKVEEGKPAPVIAVNPRVIFARENVIEADPRMNNKELLAAVFAASNLIDPTKFTDLVPADKRTIAMPLPKSLSVAFVQVYGRLPITNEVIRVMGERSLDSARSSEVGEVIRADPKLNPYGFDSLAARLDFKREKSDEEKALEKTAAAPGKS